MNPNYPDLSAWNLSGSQDTFPNQGSNYPNGNSRYPIGGPGYPIGESGFSEGRQGLPISGVEFSVGGQGPVDGRTGFMGGGPGFTGGSSDYTSGYYPSSGGFPSNPSGFRYSPQGENCLGNNPYPVAQSSGYVPGAPRLGPQPSFPMNNDYNNGSNSRTDQNICQSNSNNEIFEPTVKDAANFNPEEDCERLRKAMAGLGTNEKELIEVMGHRSPKQRAIITKKYKAIFGKELTSKFDSELSGKFHQCMVALCRTPSELDAIELRKAMRGAGTDEEVLIEILCTRTNEQIREICEAYTKIYKGRSLERDLKDETSGYFKRVLVALVQGDRDENQNVDECRARKDAEELYQAGEQRWGTDESKFIQILGHRSYAHLRLVFQHYSSLGRRDIESALKSEMSGDLLRAMLTVVRCVMNKQKYFAEKLKTSMKGAGTSDSTLIRIVVGRSGIDMARIKKEFLTLTGKTLESWIADDTSGDYRRILLTLVGE
ncbi:unnamed protein product [Schistosoma rodhaini]|uniref:Annexin n=1 Tax=Schistosoma rodhaini TaxID=6188 RepID=A0AA85G5Z3_9TREM|nr:unnamed protein product [Schistosoma rodhaini]CAH8608832.1 unnamed protein product [Schistosoma rodhaini]